MRWHPADVVHIAKHTTNARMLTGVLGIARQAATLFPAAHHRVPAAIRQRAAPGSFTTRLRQVCQQNNPPCRCSASATHLLSSLSRLCCPSCACARCITVSAASGRVEAASGAAPACAKRDCRICHNAQSLPCSDCGGLGRLPRGGYHQKRNSISAERLLGSKWTARERVFGR